MGGPRGGCLRRRPPDQSDAVQGQLTDIPARREVDMAGGHRQNGKPHALARRVAGRIAVCWDHSRPRGFQATSCKTRQGAAAGQALSGTDDAPRVKSDSLQNDWSRATVDQRRCRASRTHSQSAFVIAGSAATLQASATDLRKLSRHFRRRLDWHREGQGVLQPLR